MATVLRERAQIAALKRALEDEQRRSAMLERRVELAEASARRAWALGTWGSPRRADDSTNTDAPQ
jgi:hypothetical protein